MKTLIRVGVLTAAIAALALGAVTPAGAGDGIPTNGQVIVTPNPVELGGTVTITNADNDDSTCFSEHQPVVIWLYVYSVEDFAFEAELTAEVANDGTWSAQYTIPNVDGALGTWEVDAMCAYDAVEIEEVDTQAFAQFFYELAEFEVVGATTPDPPEEDVAPAEEVVTAPRFTG